MQQENDEQCCHVPVLDPFIRPFLSVSISSADQKSEHDQPVIEICGLKPCSGRTQLLLYIISLFLLPKVYDRIPIHGQEAAIALMDLSSTFPILRLSKIMRQQIQAATAKSSSKTKDEQGISKLVHASLDHLHIFRPQSSAAFLATVKSLASHFLDDTTKHYSANRRLAAIIITDLDAFYWQDRQASQEAEDAKLLEAENHPEHVLERTKPPHTESLLSHRYRALISSLQSSQNLFDCPIVATTSALYNPSHTHIAGRRHLTLKPHLPSVWNKFCTVKLLVQKTPVPRFPPEITVEEAERERKQRQDVVERGECEVRVDWWGSDGWAKEVREGVGRMRALGFRVNGEGVFISEGS